MLDLTCNTPKRLSDLSKENMLQFIKTRSPEEKEWFKALCISNKCKKRNNLTGEIIDGYNIPAIRKEFQKKFFSEMKKKKETTKQPSFEDELDEL